MKVIRKIATVFGFMLTVFGIVACMCETCDIGQQLVTFGIGVGMIVVGLLIALAADMEEENVFA